MDFEITHSPDVVGQQIDITIKTDGKSYIESVTTTLDSFHLATDNPAPDTTHFNRHFRQAGGYTPGDTHKLIIEAIDNNGVRKAATSIWVDN